MTSGIRDRKRARRFGAALGAVLATLVSLPAPAAADIFVGGPSAEVEILTDEFMSPEATLNFVEMAQASYFGAFVYNRAEGTWGGIANVHSLKFARARAMSLCRSESRVPSHCKDYGYVTAHGYSRSSGQTTLNSSASAMFRAYLKSTSPGGFGAFAIAPFGAAAYSGNNATSKGAAADALGKCQKVSNETRARAAPHFSADKSFFKASNWKCQVIHVQSR